MMIREKNVKKWKVVITILLGCIVGLMNAEMSEVKAETTELALNIPVQISTTEGEYQFTLERQGKVILSATSLGEKGITAGLLTLWEIDEDGNRIKLTEKGNYHSSSYSGWSAIKTTPVRLSSGTYVVTYKNQEAYKANLTIQYTEENADAFETEKNDTWGTANIINLNKEYKANLQSEDDVDMFQFELLQEGSIYLNLRNTDTIAKRWTVELYTEDEDSNKTIINSWKNTENKNSKFTKYRLPKGKYYIKVYNTSEFYFSGEDYSIGTTYVAESSVDSEIEYNDTIVDANVISVNTEYKANIPTVKDVDYYLIAIGETSNIQVQLRQENDTITQGLYNVTLYRKNNDGSLVMYGRFVTEDKTVNRGDLVLAPAGTYIVCIQNGNEVVEDKNDYYLKIQQTATAEEVSAPENIRDVSGQFGIPLAVNTTNLISVEEGRYIFSIPAEGKVTLTVSREPNEISYSGFGSVDLYGIDEDENEIFLKTSEFSEDYQKMIMQPIILPAGTYIIKYTSSMGGRYKANLKIAYSEIINLSNVVVSPIADMSYTGKLIQPKVMITYKGKILEDKKDYNITYKNNIAVGKATIILNAIEGVSKGEKKITFTIKESEKDKAEIKRVANTKAKIKSIKKVNSKTVRIKLSGLSKCTGYQIQYGTNENFKKAKNIKTKKNTVNMTTSKLKKGKKYYIRVRTYKKIAGKTYYGKWSSKKSVKIKK